MAIRQKGGGMEQLIWTEDFSVGVEQIDEQHQRLIRMINRLVAEPHAKTQSETVSDLLYNMTKYANEHFTTEEAMMRQCNYPQIEEHISQHRAYRKKIVAFCTATMNHVETVPDAMLHFLSEWWTDHVRTSDMAYKPYFLEQRLEQPADNEL